MVYIKSASFFYLEYQPYHQFWHGIAVKRKAAALWLLYPSLLYVFLIFDFFKCNIYATVAYMLHFTFLYHFFELIKRYSNSKYRRSKIYNISYKIGISLLLIVTNYDKNMWNQLFHSISSQNTSLSTTILIHHLLYSNVLFLYSIRSSVGIIPDLFRKLIFNFLTYFSAD